MLRSSTPPSPRYQASPGSGTSTSPGAFQIVGDERVSSSETWRGGVRRGLNSRFSVRSLHQPLFPRDRENEKQPRSLFSPCSCFSAREQIVFYPSRPFSPSTN